VPELPHADPEVAARAFKRHLDAYWSNRRVEGDGWERHSVDELHEVIGMPALRAEGESEPYFVLLGAEYYDLHPPTVMFVAGEAGWPRARAGTTWWPKITPPGWFGLHDESDLSGGVRGQLVCFSMTAEYYITSHSPEEPQRWRQGKHTVAATLSRLATVLQPPHYQGPDVARDS
jgi:hypothetical protein